MQVAVPCGRLAFADIAVVSKRKMEEYMQMAREKGGVIHQEEVYGLLAERMGWGKIL